jgi:hypothetical protein
MIGVVQTKAPRLDEMSDVVSLSKSRKARARAADQSKAAANRARFGMTKAQRKADQAARERAGRSLDQARREP